MNLKNEIQLALRGKIVRIPEKEYRKLMILSLGDNKEIDKYSNQIKEIEKEIKILIDKRKSIYRQIEKQSKQCIEEYSEK